MPGHFSFYSSAVQTNIALFDEMEYGHAIRTLRYKIGDEIDFTDGNGNAFTGKIGRIEKNQFFAEITGEKTAESRPGLTIYCGIIKSADRLEWLVEKCTELGVARLAFMKTQNSERSRLNLERLRKVALAAMKQSHRTWLPEIMEITWAEMLQNQHLSKFIALIPDTKEIAKQLPNSKDTAILLGPEGDFSAKEADEAIATGFIPLALGNAILRTETAAIASATWYSLMQNSAEG